MAPRWLSLRVSTEGRDRLAIALQDWITPTFAGTWANLGGGTTPAGYWKDPFGVVHLRGTVDTGALPPSTIFTLPVGYRPAFQHNFAGIRTGAGVTSRVSVLATGVVQETAGRTAAGHFLSLDGITFNAAPA